MIPSPEWVRLLFVGDLPRTVSGVVFDCDGTLLDTETCWFRAEAALFAQYDRHFGARERDLLAGLTIEAMCDIMATRFGLDGHGSRLQSELIPLVERELETGIRLMPGAEELLGTLAGRVPIALATNSTRSMLDEVLRSSGLAKCFDVTVAADEVSEPKPAPDLYLAAFDLLSVAPTHAVALEDSLTGLIAARAAGSFVIAVRPETGAPLGADFTASSLVDARLQDWAGCVELLAS